MPLISPIKQLGGDRAEKNLENYVYSAYIQNIKIILFLLRTRFPFLLFGFSLFKKKCGQTFARGFNFLMHIIYQTLLLFTLNLLDAVLTIYWVRNGFATEGNHLMAMLLDIGDLPFLAVKIAIGATAALVLWHWGNLRLARYGLAVSLVIYIGLMGVHLFTGLSAFGLLSDNFVHEMTVWSQEFTAFFA